jgi:predicted DsbA family dithiol-disulfide isomerase
MRIDIWSDVVCPWCYIGKRRFERALEMSRDSPGENAMGPETIHVVYRSFQLDPARPKGETLKRRDMLMAKYRLSADQVAAMDVRMEQTAAAEGLEYHLDDGVTGNTFDAHRLLHLAGERGLQDAVVERFFRAYFSERRSLFDDGSLTALAVEAGLDPSEVRDVLGSDRYGQAVSADAREAQTLGANGVPFFMIDRRFGVSGAQATEVFAQVLTRARESRAAL